MAHCYGSSTNRFGVVPSNRTTYTLSQFQNALKSQTGAVPYLGCGNNGTVLEEVWYFQHVFGTVSISFVIMLHSRSFFCYSTGAVWSLQDPGFCYNLDLLAKCGYLVL